MNPYDEPPPDDRYGEGAMAGLLCHWFEREGIPVTTHEVLPGRPNVIARVDGPSPTARTLLLETHMDTVPAPWLPPGKAPVATVEGDRLWGLGACDAKGCLCAMMLALRHVARLGSPVNAVFSAVVDEEHAFRGVLHLLEQGVRADGAIVGEPTEQRIVVAHKGVLRFRIIAHGVAGHASKPNDAQNAIVRMAHLVQRLASDYTPNIGRRTHPVLGPATVNIGRIWGGTQVNIVPDRCVIDVDRRYLPQEHTDAMLAEIDALIDELAHTFGQEAYTREAPYLDSVPLDSSPNVHVAAALEQSHLAVLGTSAQRLGVPFGTDASKIQAGGIPCVVYGPGSIEQAHSPEEYVSIRAVQEAAGVYAHWLLHS